jgi:arylsulfatase A-like enzyme
MKTRGKPFALPLAEVTVAEMVKQAPRPYATSMVGKWHLANQQFPDYAANPNHQGFDWWAGSVGNLQIASSLPSAFAGNHDYFHWERVENGKPAIVRTYATTDTTDTAIARLEAMPEPWLLYVAYNAPHAPYHTPPRELYPRGRPYPPTTARGSYAATVEVLDREIGRLLDAIPAEVRARTTVIVLGDNGTPEEAVGEPLLPARSKGTMYEGGVRVPLIVNGPDVARPGARSAALVHVVDLFPTIAELAGLSPGRVRAEDGSRVALDGQSLLPLLRDPDTRPERVLYTERFAPNGSPPYTIDERAVRDQDFKLLRDKSGGEHLYELSTTGWWLDEGQDLLKGELDDRAQASLASLREELARFDRELAYAHEAGTTEGGGEATDDD